MAILNHKRIIARWEKFLSIVRVFCSFDFGLEYERWARLVDCLMTRLILGRIDLCCNIQDDPALNIEVS